MSSRKITTRQLYNLIFPLACYFVFAYPVFRIINWYGASFEFTFLHSLGVGLLGLVGMMYSFRGPNMVVRYIVVHWMGASFIFACLTLLGELVQIIPSISEKSIAIAILVTGIFFVILAILISHHLHVKKIKILSKKIKQPCRIVQISDVHIGSRQKGFMQRIVNKINSLKPDLVAVTGDLIDSSAVNQEALQSIAEIDAKTFFTIGNHERYADLEKILDIADNLGMQTLRQATVIHDEISISGIDDADRKDQVNIHLPEMKLKTEEFNLLLYHRPVGWESAMDHGVDLMLSGHTHNGQIFPFNFLVKKQFKRIKGLYKNNHHHLYVSPGTGTWGPLMRLGTMNEITLIELEPES